MAAVPPITLPVDGGTVTVRCTTRADGDLNADRVAPADLARRWRRVAGRPVTWLREVHGTEVLVVERPGHRAGATADAAVTAAPGAALGIWVGDCAPVALVARSGVVGAVHVGWRGLAAGVLDRALDAMVGLGAAEITAVVGPCVHPECYEFGAADLDDLAARLGPVVHSRTSWGAPALDLPGAVGAALAARGVAVLDTPVPCTACDPDYWSHRRRGDLGRQGLAVWAGAA